MVAIYQSNIKSLPLLCRGKVRDLYTLDDEHILMVASDRLSAFDVVFPTAIPDKGRVLTSVSAFWFNKTRSIVPNHTTDIVATERVAELQHDSELTARSMVVKKIKPLAIEAIVRGYLYGSAWNEYQKHGKLSGIDLEAGLRLADRLPEAIFTPTTKAAIGEHDVPISFEAVAAATGLEMAKNIRDTALALYRFCSDYAYQRGVIVADTKFEFGVDEKGDLVLIDEMVTPDSSRFWDLQSYQPGSTPLSFDKQYVRNYLLDLGWQPKMPPPALPAEIVNKTQEKYQSIEHLLLAKEPSR